MPQYSHTVQVAAAPHDVFAIVDDTSRTPDWLSRCTRLDKLDDGPNQVGTPLRYYYRDGRRTGEMAGDIAVREPDRRLALRFVDKMMDVTVDFVTAPGDAPGSTSLTHTIDITTKGIGKIFTPMIKRGLPKQTIDAMEKLKALAERG